MLGASETPGFQDPFRSSSGSSGVPEPVPEGHAVTFEDSYRVAADGDDDRDIDNDIACCEFTLPDAGDERRFERMLSRRVFLFYWLVCVFARLAESANVLSSGLGVSLPGQLWTAIFVLCSSAAVTEPSFRAACEARAHYLMAGYMLTNHLVRVVLLHSLSDDKRDVHVRRVYASMRTPLFYLFTVLIGFCLAFIGCGKPRFQAAFTAAHLALSFLVTRAAGAAFGPQGPMWLAWAITLCVANGLVYGVLKPLWLRSRRGANEALKCRVEQLGREKERVVWEWQLDVSRRAPRLEPGDGGGSSSPEDYSDRSKRLGGVVLAGSPTSLPSVDLDF